MRYGLMASMMPLILDKTIYSYLSTTGINTDKVLKNKIRNEYKAIVARTPGLDKKNPLMKTLYIGCYLIAFYKGAPDIIDESRFEGIIKALCDEMMRREKESDSVFSPNTIKMRRTSAEKSQNSKYEMDWVSTFRQNSNDSYEFTYTKCGLCELGKREGCFHLIKYLCLTDFISFDKGGARLERPHSLANGDDCCDFHVYRKEKR